METYLIFHCSKVRGDDNLVYTIQLLNIDRKKSSQTRSSLTPHQSTVSMILPNAEKKTSSFPIVASTSKLPSHDTPAGLSMTRSTRTTFPSTQARDINAKLPFLDAK